MKINRPFDALNSNKEKDIEVELKNSRIYKGKLEAFDIHLNLTLSDATEVANGKESQVGNIIIRGDSIILIKNLE